MKELHDFLGEIDQLDEEGRTELAALLDRTSELKQLPLIARKVMQVIEDPKSTAGDLERVLSTDQSLTVKILKIANSSFYGLLRKVSTLQRAILVVGFKAIKDIAVSTAILNMYRSADPISIKMWENAVGCGIAARLLSLEFDSTETDEAFVSGLLHNLGKSVLLRTYPDEYRHISKALQENPDIDDQELERKVFHFSHSHVGGALAKSWNLSPSLEAAMRYYRYLREVLWTDIDIEVKTNIALVSYSVRFCRRLGIGYDAPLENYELVDCPENEFLKIPAERIEELAEEIKMSFFSENQLFS